MKPALATPAEREVLQRDVIAQLAADEYFIGNVVAACRLAAEMLAKLPAQGETPQGETPQGETPEQPAAQEKRAA